VVTSRDCAFWLLQTQSSGFRVSLAALVVYDLSTARHMGKAIEMSVWLDRVLLDQIAGRWQLLILGALCDHGHKARFNALKRAVPGISQKTLTQCLRQLERSGLVARRVLTDSPLGVEYSFTPLGDTLEAPVRALYTWTPQYSAAVRTAQEAYDADRSRKDARSASKTLTEKGPLLRL
jgi:DNA-binding HxlR family transcriptional regulator